MDGNFEEPENTQYSSQEATQEAATQELPPHYGVPPSNKTSLDESDIYCFLHPNTEAAIAIVKKAVIDNPHMVYQRPVTMKSLSTGDSGGSALDEGVGSAYDICLRKYPGPKNPEAGFVFGRSERNCDIVLSKDGRFLSNTHFRIYPTSRNILVLEDTSTNGTWVDEQILCRSGWSTAGKSRMLGNGSVILLCKNNVQKPYDVIRFTVRFPNSRGTPNLRPLGSPPPTPPDDGISQAHGNAAAAKWRQPEYPLKTEVTDNTDDSLGKWGMNSRFLIENLIGRGAFAVVHRVFERSSGQIYAVKIMQKRAFAHNTKDNQQGVRKEVDILRELDHPNIVKYIHVYEDTTSVYMVMEYIEHGDLNTYLNEHGTMPVELTKMVIVQILEGLKYIHNKGVSHRDLKPDNILISELDPMMVKISDFGLAKMVSNEDSLLRTFCGTMLYLAPEVYPTFLAQTIEANQGSDGNHKRKRPPNDNAGRNSKPAKKAPRVPYTDVVDMWSFGCIVYCLLVGKPPFEGKNQEDMMNSVVRYSPSLNKIMQAVGPAEVEECMDFIGKLLQVNPALRLREDGALKHPWIRKYVATTMGGDDKVIGVKCEEEPQDDPSQMRDEVKGLDEDEDEEEGVEAISTTPVSSLECSALPDSQPDPGIDQDLRWDMEKVSFTQHKGSINEFGSDVRFHQHGNLLGGGRNSSSNAEPHSSSTGDLFESVVNSQQSFNQGKFCLSVIERAEADARSAPSPLCESSDIEEEEEEEEEEFQSAQRLGGAFRYESPGLEKGPPIQKQANLGFEDTSSNAVFATAPLRQTMDHLQPASSPLSFANANFNFSPESLRHHSSIMDPPAIKLPMSVVPTQVPKVNVPLATQPTIAEEPAKSPNPTPKSSIFGRLVPLPGSINTDIIILNRPTNWIGRRPNNPHFLQDERISRSHLVIAMAPPDYFCNFKNSTYKPPADEDWEPTPEMIVAMRVDGLSGAHWNDEYVKPGEKPRRLLDGDEIVLFYDPVNYKKAIEKGKKVERHGYQVVLTAGDVTRRDKKGNVYRYSKYPYEELSTEALEAMAKDLEAMASSRKEDMVPGGSAASTENGRSSNFE